MEGFGGRKEIWEMMQLHYNLKKIKVEKETKTPWFEHKALIKKWNKSLFEQYPTTATGGQQSPEEESKQLVCNQMQQERQEQEAA